jgi:hypothetical protein
MLHLKHLICSLLGFSIVSASSSLKVLPSSDILSNWVDNVEPLLELAVQLEVTKLSKDIEVSMLSHHNTDL